jgi:hypothetical protein
MIAHPKVMNSASKKHWMDEQPVPTVDSKKEQIYRVQRYLHNDIMV